MTSIMTHILPLEKNITNGTDATTYLMKVLSAEDASLLAVDFYLATPRECNDTPVAATFVECLRELSENGWNCSAAMQIDQPNLRL